jgi:hypothetical protein
MYISPYSSHYGRFTLVESFPSTWVWSLSNSDDLKKIKIYVLLLKPLFLGHPVCSLVGRSNKRYLFSGFRFFKTHIPRFFCFLYISLYFRIIQIFWEVSLYQIRRLSVCFATLFLIKNCRSLMWHVTTIVSEKCESILRNWVGPF